MEELIAKRYVTALTSASKNITSITKILNVLTEVISNDEVMTILKSPIILTEKKTEMILSAIGDGADVTLTNFIKILGENKRLDLIPAITTVLNKELQKSSNKYEGVIKSAKRLSKEDLSKLEEILENYSGAKIKLKQQKDLPDSLRILVDDLGIEVNFSKQRVKEQLIDFIKKSL
ncbi:MAG: F0F1 ATP synthase subunit delta [Sulfurovum sp.]|nr:F0F1 ATP synthase subunit delta [Sulfurovum sp.]MCB4744359.1 F0F1 ATP synthase subunit delta [Sulfurovum sp.]MCB4746471.1 F0F1 ATP synthase subunit delta [Sulfurovum sp.]MCB4749438.1 F0F1 ATP synthase subunit delta [Sulfurovum sp.]MCB4750511.1 F0F1 ATP synthase subunit delta [Sulfurovum sp.]